MILYYTLFIIGIHNIIQTISTTDLNIYQTLRHTSLVEDRTYKARNIGISTTFIFNHKFHNGVFQSHITDFTFDIYYFKKNYRFKRDYGYNGQLCSFLENSDLIEEIGRFSHKDSIGTLHLKSLNVTELSYNFSNLNNDEDYDKVEQNNYSYINLFLKKLNTKGNIIVEDLATNGFFEHHPLRFKMIYKTDIHKNQWYNEIASINLEGDNVIYEELDNSAVENDKYNCSKDLQGLILHEKDYYILNEVGGSLLFNCLKAIDRKEAANNLNRKNETIIEINDSKFTVSFKDSQTNKDSQKNNTNFFIYSVISMSGILLLIYVIKELVIK